MNQKQVGIILIIIGLLFSIFIFMSKEREDIYIKELMKSNDGSCFLEDGTCLHADRTFANYVIGGSLSVALVILGLYIGFIDKTQKILTEHQIKVSRALENAKKEERIKDEFAAFVAGFSEDEQKILKAVYDQDGIKQSTLRYRTGISKTQLSLILKKFEEKGIVSKKPSGKTNLVYLQKKF